MIRIALLFILYLITSCSSTRSSRTGVDDADGIVYFIQHNVSDSLVTEMNKKKGRYFFRLASHTENIFTIAMILKHDSTDLWATSSNRKLFLKGQLYPLIFDYDDLFATSDVEKDILRKAATTEYFEIGMHRTLYHYFFYITFRRDGGILTSGYEGLTPN